MKIKKIMHVLRHAPHGTIYSYEGVEMILIMATSDAGFQCIVSKGRFIDSMEHDNR